MKTEYECEKCGLESHVPRLNSEYIFQLMNRILEDHKKWSRECDNPVSNFRVFCDKVEE